MGLPGAEVEWELDSCHLPSSLRAIDWQELSSHCMNLSMKLFQSGEWHLNWVLQRRGRVMPQFLLWSRLLSHMLFCLMQFVRNQSQSTACTQLEEIIQGYGPQEAGITGGLESGYHILQIFLCVAKCTYH